MLVIKLLLVVVLAIAPVNAILALPVVSPAVVIAVIGLSLLIPEWGPWVFAGVCASLVQFRLWLLWTAEPSQLRYSPAIAIQNSASAWLFMAGIIGAVRSWYAADVVGAVMGLLIGVTLLILQGFLFRAN